MRGESLRELQRFLEKHDTNKTYAGLRRLGDDDGTAVWTVLTDEKGGVRGNRAALRGGDGRRIRRSIMRCSCSGVPKPKTSQRRALLPTHRRRTRRSVGCSAEAQTRAPFLAAPRPPYAAADKS